MQSSKDARLFISNVIRDAVVCRERQEQNVKIEQVALQWLPSLPENQISQLTNQTRQSTSFRQLNLELPDGSSEYIPRCYTVHIEETSESSTADTQC
jgi:diketogulonate reductase-like aldo/keto reductase